MSYLREPEVEAPTVSLPPEETFRILILDSQEHIDELKFACKNAGFAVVGAKTIEEAFLFLDGKDHADVIICGAYLEHESVFEFLRRLRLDKVHKHAVFMMLALEASSLGIKSSPSIEKTGRLLGADGFINMPIFDPAQLILEIRKVLPPIPNMVLTEPEDA